MIRSFIQHLTTLLLLMVIVSCASIPRFTSKKSINDWDNTEDRGSVYFDRYSDLSEVLETEIGLASFYADDFHGKLTFTEEVYDMYGTTAAHPTYPMNTIIRVTNTSNDRQIKIRINDRMPQHPDRIIDLSLGSAQELDMVEDGISEVRVEVLKWGE
jgi:rare lipoprotein A